MCGCVEGWAAYLLPEFECNQRSYNKFHDQHDHQVHRALGQPVVWSEWLSCSNTYTHTKVNGQCEWEMEHTILS